MSIYRKSSEDRPPDGRRLRSERTRVRLLDAAIEIIREIDDVPTLGDVAKRGKTGLRTVYQHFPTASALYAATFDHALSTIRATQPDFGPDTPLAERIRGYVERRAATCEAWGPLWRIYMRLAVRDEALRAKLDMPTQYLRWRLETLFAPEFAPLPPEGRSTLLDSLVATLDPEVWARLRVTSGRDIESARAAWRFMLEALLSGASGLPGTR